MQIVGWKNYLKLANETLPAWALVKDVPVTEPQKKYLRGLGVGASGLTKTAANAVIKIALHRRNEGLATPGQMWALATMNVKQIQNVTFAQAKDILDEDYKGRRAPDRFRMEVKVVWW